jgi:hypothetical protein
MGFTRNSIAYTQDGVQTPANTPRFDNIGLFDNVFVILFVASPFTRNSEAYNLDYSIANSNIPRFWNMGTKCSADDVTVQKVGVSWPLVNNLCYSQYDDIANDILLFSENTSYNFYLPDYIDNHLRIIFKGTNSTGGISITINNQTLTYNNSLTLSDIVTIDCIRQKVEKNFVSSTISGNYPAVVSGVNTVSYALSGDATLSYLAIETRTEYFGNAPIGVQIIIPNLPDYPILPLQSNLTDIVSDLNMIYSRNSEAYNIDYTLVNSNIPRYWSLGTKNAT